MTVLLTGGMVYTMTGDAKPFVGDVLIRGRLIEQVAEKIKVQVDQTIDCSGKVVLPGLIDAHCHIGLFGTAMGERGVDGNESSEPCTPELRAIDAINPFDDEFEHSWRHGITTVCTGPGSGNPIAGQFVTLKTWGTALSDRIVSQPAAMKMAFGENPKSSHEGKAPRTRMATAAIIREALSKAMRYQKDIQQAESDGKTPPPPDMKCEALLPVLRRELQVKAHAHRADDILTALRIAEEFNLDLSIEHGSEAHLIPGMLSGARGVILGPLMGFPHKLEVKNQSAKAGLILSNHRVLFAIMSDLPASHTDGIILAAGACVREGLDPLEALRAITINPARILGIEQRVGSISPGKDADIAVFSRDPLVYVNACCEMTLIEGQVVHQV